MSTEKPYLQYRDGAVKNEELLYGEMETRLKAINDNEKKYNNLKKKIAKDRRINQIIYPSD